jgi:two-component system KDP operon response regulator KdpE
MDLKTITTETASSRVSPVAQSVPKNSQPGKRRILIVDDDPIILKTTEIKLKEHGFAVTTATDGPTAIHAARTETPDLILLDLSFPADVTLTWDGFSIMNWLRRLESTKNVPVIIFTGLQGDNHYQRARAAGVAGFFHKPLNFGPLLSLIDLRLKSQAPAQPAKPAEPPLKLRLAP